MQRIYMSLVAIILLLTLVGQAVASVTMNCEMPHMGQTHASSNNDASMHHAAEMMDMDCCGDKATPAKQDCSCPVNACSAHSILSMSTFFTVSLVLSEKVLMPLSETQDHLTSSLYRPPMSA